MGYIIVAVTVAAIVSWLALRAKKKSLSYQDALEGAETEESTDPHKAEKIVKDALGKWGVHALIPILICATVLGSLAILVPPAWNFLGNTNIWWAVPALISLCAVAAKYSGKLGTLCGILAGMISIGGLLYSATTKSEISWEEKLRPGIWYEVPIDSHSYMAWIPSKGCFEAEYNGMKSVMECSPGETPRIAISDKTEVWLSENGPYIFSGEIQSLRIRSLSDEMIFSLRQW